MVRPAFEILGHTADVRLHATGKSVEELFRHALQGMGALLKRARSTGDVPRHIRVSSADRNALLVDFLNEALYLSNAHKEVYTDVLFRSLTETECDAQLQGVPVGAFDEDVKAVTYHEAEIKRTPDGFYEVTLVCDI